MANDSDELPPLFHYTDRPSAADIIRDRMIKAHPQTLHRDMFARDEGFVTPPIIWLTTDCQVEMTVVSKISYANPEISTMVGAVWRICLPGRYCTVNLSEYTDSRGIDPDWWNWVVSTGRMVRSDLLNWRVHSADIPAADWLKVEVLKKVNSDLTTEWTEVEM